MSEINQAEENKLQVEKKLRNKWYKDILKSKLNLILTGLIVLTAIVGLSVNANNMAKEKEAKRIANNITSINTITTISDLNTVNIKKLSLLEQNALENKRKQLNDEKKAVQDKLDLENKKKEELKQESLVKEAEEKKKKLENLEPLPKYEIIDENLNRWVIVKIEPNLDQNKLVLLAKKLHKDYKLKQEIQYIDSLDGYEQYKIYQKVDPLTVPIPKDFMNNHMPAWSKYLITGMNDVKSDGTYLLYPDDRTIKLN